MDTSGDWFAGMWDEEGSASLTNITDEELFENVTLTCAARSLSRPAVQPFPQALVNAVQNIQSLCYIFIFLFGLGLNSAVIVLVAKYRKLHSRSFIIALQVVVSNVLICSTVYLLRPITALAK